MSGQAGVRVFLVGERWFQLASELRIRRFDWRGHLGRLLLGLDLGRRSSFRAYGGGPGMRYLMETFVPRLRRRIGEEAVDAILIANPARTFALQPAIA